MLNEAVMVEKKEARNQSEFEKQAKEIFLSANTVPQLNLGGLTLNRWACETWFGAVKRSYNLTDKDTQDINGAISTISMSNNGITKKPRSFFETLQLIFRKGDAREHNRYLVQDAKDDYKTKIISQATKDADENRYNVISTDKPPQSLRNSIAHLHANGRQLNPLYPIAITFSALAMGAAALIDKALSSKEPHAESSLGAKAVKYAIVSPLFVISRTFEGVGNLASFAAESSIKWLISGGKKQKNENKEEDVFKQADNAKPVLKKSAPNTQATVYQQLSIPSEVVANNLQADHEVNNKPTDAPAQTHTNNKKKEEIPKPKMDVPETPKPKMGIN